MSIKYFMKFKLYSLIDITETGGRRGDDPRLVKQQQNYLTVIQTIGIRANPEIVRSPKTETINVSKLGFGSEFRGNKPVWILDFEFGLNQEHSIEDLESDFELVPIIGGLDENIEVEDWVFRTSDPRFKNIVFVKED
jgi:hypothetical protein